MGSVNLVYFSGVYLVWGCDGGLLVWSIGLYYYMFYAPRCHSISDEDSARIESSGSFWLLFYSTSSLLLDKQFQQFILFCIYILFCCCITYVILLIFLVLCILFKSFILLFLFQFLPFCFLLQTDFHSL